MEALYIWTLSSALLMLTALVCFSAIPNIVAVNDRNDDETVPRSASAACRRWSRIAGIGFWRFRLQGDHLVAVLGKLRHIAHQAGRLIARRTEILNEARSTHSCWHRGYGVRLPTLSLRASKAQRL
jgi:hypothetical protein